MTIQEPAIAWSPLVTVPQGAVQGNSIHMAKTYGAWLRAQRHARGWTVPEMRRHLREAARAAGDTLPSNDCLSVMIRRWESDRGGISERYRMHFCRMLQITFDEFGQAPAATASPAIRQLGPAEHLEPAPAAHDPGSSGCVYLSPNIRLAIRAACYEALRGVLTDILGHLSPNPLSYNGGPSASGQDKPDVSTPVSA